ncbi:MAG: hypothetical protein EBE86_008430 [Hormoscilla sp. GUM202]|nr:hypothetical protein [Hormoscilla sp. GUM202]
MDALHFYIFGSRLQNTPPDPGSIGARQAIAAPNPFPGGDRPLNLPARDKRFACRPIAASRVAIANLISRTLALSNNR